jgi:hypothetical protein
MNETASLRNVVLIWLVSGQDFTALWTLFCCNAFPCNIHVRIMIISCLDPSTPLTLFILVFTTCLGQTFYLVFIACFGQTFYLVFTACFGQTYYFGFHMFPSEILFWFSQHVPVRHDHSQVLYKCMKIYFYKALHTWVNINVLWYNANLTSLKIKIKIKLK